MVVSEMVWEAERPGTLDSTDGTLIGTSIQSVQDVPAGARSDCSSSSCETASEQQLHDRLSAPVGPSSSVQTTKPSTPVALLRTSSVASIKTVAVIGSRGCLLIVCRCVTERESRSHAVRIQHYPSASGSGRAKSHESSCDCRGGCGCSGSADFSDTTPTILLVAAGRAMASWDLAVACGRIVGGAVLASGDFHRRARKRELPL